jgi:hypothetical protein
MNTGKRYYGEGGIDILAILAHVLDIPLGYFYPPTLYQEIKQEDLTPLENILLLHFRYILDNHLQEIAIRHVKKLYQNLILSKY